MSKEQKSRAAVQAILDYVNQRDRLTDKLQIIIERDFGGNSLTVIFPNEGHGHIGQAYGSLEDLCTALANLLNNRVKAKTDGATQG